MSILNMVPGQFLCVHTALPSRYHNDCISYILLVDDSIRFNGHLTYRRRRVSLSLEYSSRPETKLTSLPPGDGIAWLPNYLGELNPYTTTSFRILPGIQQIGNWSALYWTCLLYTSDAADE